MARIVVLGAGMIGKFVASRLSEHDLLVVDNCQESLKGLDCETLCGSAFDVLSMEDVDVWVNMLPGRVGHAVRQPLLNKNQTIVDLAFTPEDPRNLQGGRMVYDVGIAPGLSNLWSAAIKDIEKLEIKVGGIPCQPDDGWSYMAPFSPSDVIEEYTRPARVIIAGEQKEIPPLEMRHMVEIENVGTLEAAITDGLRSLLDTIEADSMLEYTLRWPGHYDKWLASSQDEELANEWQFDSSREEMTVMTVAATTKGGEWNGYLIDYGKGGDSSMARTTGLVTLAAIDAALAGLIPEGVYPPEGVVGLLPLAEKRLQDAGVQIKRDSFFLE
jgi:saccharopine dehydrogenase-like NADP-dependent oxidoreductase